MSASAGVILCQNVSGAQTTPPMTWRGGQTALCLNATAYDGTTCFLQGQGPSGAWININGSKFSADQMTSYFLPAGTYRMNLGASTSGLYASLVLVPQD